MTLIAANVDLPLRAGVRRIDIETTDQLAQAARAEFPTSHVLLMAAAPADFRADRGRRGQAEARGRPRTRSAADRGHPRLPGRAPERPSQTIVGFAAEHGGTRSPGPRQARPQGRRPDRPQRRLRPRDRLRERPERGDPDRRQRRDRGPAGGKDTVAEAILDRVERLRAAGAGRRDSPSEPIVARKRAFRPSGSASYTEPQAFSPTVSRSREVGLAHFFRPNRPQDQAMQEPQP